MSIAGLIRDWVVDPLGMLFLLSLLFLAILAMKRINLCLIVATIVWLGAVVFVSGPFVVNPMLTFFEDKYSANPECLVDQPIVILGGGLDSRATRADDLHFLDPPTYTRLIAGRSLAERFPKAQVLVAGGALVEVSEGVVMESFLTQTGMGASRIHKETRSRNTYENALNIKQLLASEELGESITLVTSALHMTRAEAVFVKQGMNVCAVAVDRQGLHNVPLFALWPQTSALLKFDLLLHEVIAMLTYKIKGQL